MFQPQFRTPFRAVENFFTSYLHATKPQFRTSLNPTTAALSKSPFSPSNSPLSRLQVRYASHNTQGAANAAASNRPGKRLGAKKTGEQYVIPGNIIYRQRGTLWFPGENCGMGRDHTIFAQESGYVKYYKDPERHPDRKYIGVAFERNQVLPTPKNAPTKRRFGMIAIPMRKEPISVVGNGGRVVNVDGSGKPPGTATPRRRHDHQYRAANWEIGRAGDIAGVQAKEWKRKDRWTAWNSRLEKVKRVAQMKEVKKRKKVVKSKQKIKQ